ncbi:MAG: GNAT family N-acetyltransferase [Phycisphaerales bacterium]
MTILHAHSGALLETARELFAEYGRSIADVAACSLQHQHFDAELDSLPGLYAPPRGCILIAQAGLGPAPVPNAQSPVPSPAGCIALRPLPALGAGVCELKRMYVRPPFRGTGLGRRMALQLIAFAKAAGYRTMKLDTSTTMHAAIGLYTSLGFVPCERYNDDPMTDTLWLDLRL